MKIYLKLFLTANHNGSTKRCNDFIELNTNEISFFSVFSISNHSALALFIRSVHSLCSLIIILALFPVLSKILTPDYESILSHPIHKKYLFEYIRRNCLFT